MISSNSWSNDGSHMLILKLQKMHLTITTGKGYYSVIMQAVVEFHRVFMDINIGLSGKVHDACVLVIHPFLEKAAVGLCFLAGHET